MLVAALRVLGRMVVGGFAMLVDSIAKSMDSQCSSSGCSHDAVVIPDAGSRSGPGSLERQRRRRHRYIKTGETSGTIQGATHVGRHESCVGVARRGEVGAPDYSFLAIVGIK